MSTHQTDPETLPLSVFGIGRCGPVRRRVFAAARDGRAALLPAGARDNQNALVIIDGEVVGQASTCASYVAEETSTHAGMPFSPTFSQRRLVPEPEHLLPRALRA